ncbi:hypothetical protein GCM10010836_24480 [Aminobacter aminovorans]
MSDRNCAFNSEQAASTIFIEVSQRQRCCFCSLRLLRWHHANPLAAGDPENRKGTHVTERECDQSTMKPSPLILEDALDQLAMMCAGPARS